MTLHTLCCTTIRLDPASLTFIERDERERNRSLKLIKCSSKLYTTHACELSTSGPKLLSFCFEILF